MISPIRFTGLLWIGSIIFVSSGIIKYVDLSTGFYIAVALAALCFFIGNRLGINSICATQGSKPPCQNSIFYEPKKNSAALLMIFFAAGAMQILLLLYNFWALTGFEGDMSSYRAMLTDQGIKLHFLPVIAALNGFCFLLLPIAVQYSKSKIIIAIALVMLIVISLLSTGRATLMVVVLMTLWYCYFTRKLRLSGLFFLLCAYFVFFYLVGVAQGKIGEDIKEHFMYVSDAVPKLSLLIPVFNVLVYATSGIVAVSEYIAINDPFYGFNYMAANFYKVFPWAFSDVGIYNILPNANVPFPTNVYTFIFVPYADWGLFGIGVTFLLYGYLSGAIYKYYTTKGTVYASLLLTLCFTVLSLSTFHDYMFSSFFPYTVFVVLFYFRNSLNTIVR